jgi:hypothetical protein
VQNAEDAHDLFFDFVNEDVVAVGNQLPGILNSTRPTEPRKPLKPKGKFVEPLVERNRGARIVCLDEIVNGVAIC